MERLRAVSYGVSFIFRTDWILVASTAIAQTESADSTEDMGKVYNASKILPVVDVGDNRAAIEGQNLLGTARTSYYGVETRPQSAWINDRQISATLMVQL